MNRRPTTAAQVFALRFPTARDQTGWTEPNLHLLTAEAERRRISLSDFDAVCTELLASPARERLPVPPYGEVAGALARFQQRRATDRPDGALERLRGIQRAYTPPTPEEKAIRRRWLDAFKAGDKEAMREANRALRAIAPRGSR